MGRCQRVLAGTVFDGETAMQRNHAAERMLQMKQLLDEIEPGDVLVSPRGGIWHYGIYTGNGSVVERVPLKDRDGTIWRVSLWQFCKGRPNCVSVRNETEPTYSPRETVRRAEAAIGSKGYDVFEGNCEHFANWCKWGDPYSGQAESGKWALLCVGVVALLSLAEG